MIVRGPWHTGQEVASAAGMQYNRLAVLASLGSIPSVKFGGRRLFHFDEMMAFFGRTKLKPPHGGLQSPWVSVAESADWLRVAPVTVYRTLWRVPLPAVRDGQVWRIDLPALDGLLLSSRDV